MTIKKKEIKKIYKKFAQNCDWDELASAIIDLELKITKTKNKKILKKLNIELEIYEEEKACRIYKSFDMEYFLNKDIEYFEEDPFDISDI